MSCTSYFDSLSEFLDDQVPSNHPNIRDAAGGAAGAAGGAQTDGGVYNLIPVPGFPFPGAGGSLNGAALSQVAQSTYTSYAADTATWLEQWVIRDEASFDNPPQVQLWSQTGGDALDEEELAVLEVESKAAGGAPYQLAAMSFVYRLMPTLAQRGAAPTAPADCIATRQLFELWNVEEGTVGANAQGALLRERLTLADGSQQRVDHFLLARDYLPPKGTTEVIFHERPAGQTPSDLSAFLAQYLDGPGAGPFGNRQNGQQGRYVYIPYDLIPLT